MVLHVLQSFGSEGGVILGSWLRRSFMLNASRLTPIFITGSRGMRVPMSVSGLVFVMVSEGVSAVVVGCLVSWSVERLAAPPEFFCRRLNTRLSELDTMMNVGGCPHH